MSLIVTGKRKSKVVIDNVIEVVIFFILEWITPLCLLQLMRYLSVFVISSTSFSLSLSLTHTHAVCSSS